MTAGTNKQWAYQDAAKHGSEMRERFLHPEKGVHTYFRSLCLRSQRRFAELFPCADAPRVFLHGNPHIDNYARIGKRTGLIDFDRSRLGPYAWDLARFLGSLLLYSPDMREGRHAERIAFMLYEAYTDGFKRGAATKFHCTILDAVPRKRWQKSVTAYLASGKKWAQKLAEHAEALPSAESRAILVGYLASRSESATLRDHQLTTYACVRGSLGHPHHLFVLSPPAGEALFIDIKPTYADVDTAYFSNPFKHHGVRMNEASRLYAPGMEKGLGYATHAGTDYWGRHIPCFKAKIKENLNLEQTLELALAVGRQLGRGHRASLHYACPEALLGHLSEHRQRLSELTWRLDAEIREGYELYCEQLTHPDASDRSA